jgi:hypothetical protein
VLLTVPAVPLIVLVKDFWLLRELKALLQGEGTSALPSLLRCNGLIYTLHQPLVAKALIKHDLQQQLVLLLHTPSDRQIRCVWHITVLTVLHATVHTLRLAAIGVFLAITEEVELVRHGLISNEVLVDIVEGVGLGALVLPEVLIQLPPDCVVKVNPCTFVSHKDEPCKPNELLLRLPVPLRALAKDDWHGMLDLARGYLTFEHKDREALDVVIFHSVRQNPANDLLLHSDGH